MSNACGEPFAAGVFHRCRFLRGSFVAYVEPTLTRLLTCQHIGDTTMRFMVIVKADQRSEAGVMPTEKELADMAKFNEQLVKAGVMLAGDGLQPSSKGARVRF